RSYESPIMTERKTALRVYRVARKREVGNAVASSLHQFEIEGHACGYACGFLPTGFFELRNAARQISLDVAPVHAAPVALQCRINGRDTCDEGIELETKRPSSILIEITAQPVEGARREVAVEVLAPFEIKRCRMIDDNRPAHRKAGAIHRQVERACGNGKVLLNLGKNDILRMRLAGEIHLVHLHVFNEGKGELSFKAARATDTQRIKTEIADEAERLMVEHAQYVRHGARNGKGYVSRRALCSHFIDIEM